jgi:hypothetical protein
MGPQSAIEQRICSLPQESAALEVSENLSYFLVFGIDTKPGM